VNERDRIRAAYARRAERGLDDRYAYWEPANLFMFQERERSLLRLLRGQNLLPLGDRRILDLGCGDGSVMRDFLRYGAKPPRLLGVDIIPGRIASAIGTSPNFAWQIADGSALPFKSGSFDLVSAFTVFSSIKDRIQRKLVADEALRVLKPGGAIVWYDFWTNPFNRDVRPVPLAEVRNLFPGCSIEARRVTLAPPLVRLLAARAWPICRALAVFPFLRTHWLAVIICGPRGGPHKAV
jgi:SAM-dependent methyltransferase